MEAETKAQIHPALPGHVASEGMLIATQTHQPAAASGLLPAQCPASEMESDRSSTEACSGKTLLWEACQASTQMPPGLEQQSGQHFLTPRIACDLAADSDPGLGCQQPASPLL